MIKRIIVFIFILGTIFSYSSYAFKYDVNNIELFKDKLKKGILKQFKEEDRDKLSVKFPEIRSYNVLAGYVPVIKVRAENIWLNNLKASIIYFEFLNIKLNMDKLYEEEIIRADSHMKIKIYSEISEESLNDLLILKEKKIKVKNPKVEIRDGAIYLYGHVKAMFISSYIKCKGSFYVKDKKKIHFSAKYIALNKVKLPKFLLIKIVNSINPVLDLEESYFDMCLRDIEMVDGKVIITSFDKDFKREKIFEF